MRDTRPALLELTIIRVKEFLRETEAIFWVFGFPLLLALALGFAFRDKAPDKIPIGVVAGPNAASRVAALRRSPVLAVREYDAAAGAEALKRGKISLLIGGPAENVFRFDPTRPDARTARIEADNALQTAAGRHDALAIQEQHVGERGSRYIDFLIPGLLGMNLMGTGIWGMAFPIVNSRTKKLLKRLVATPMRRSEYLIAQFLSRAVFLVVEVTVLIVFARLVFDVRVDGSFLVLALFCLLGGTAFASVGLLVASRARTIEAVSGLSNLVMMPMWLCSGVFFSYERFPDAAKPVIRALPLTALNDALRGVMNDALPLAQLWPQLAILLLWTLIPFFIGIRIFRWN